MDALDKAPAPSADGSVSPTYHKPAFFLSESWSAHLELIEHLCHYSSHLLLVLGSALSGKTSFLEVSLHRETPGLIKQKLSLGRGEAASQLLASIHAHTTVLLVDNAEKASDEVLLALLKRSSAYQPKDGIHLVFFATPGLEVRLIQPLFLPYIQGRVHSIELEPFTTEEAMTFLSRAQFDYPEIPARDTEQLQRLIEKSGGYPGKLLNLARSKSRSWWHFALPFKQLSVLGERPFFWVLLFAIGLCVAFVLFNTTGTFGKTEPHALVIPMGKGMALLEAEQEPAPALAPVIGYGPAPALLPSPKEVPVEVVVEAPPVEEVPVQATVEEAPAPPTVAMVEEVSAPPLEAVIPVTQVKPLKAARSGEYTVQLLGASNERKIQQFIEQFSLKEAYYVQSSLKGKPWYILSYGHFKTKEQAETARQNLPKPVRDLNPWIRRVE